MDTRWTEANIPDQHGRVVVITGANSGIGWETARALAAKGAHVVMAVRSAEKGQTAKAEILRQYPQAQVDVSVLDLSSLTSVRQFSEAFSDQHPSLSLLINNAGVMAVPYAKTKDGFELQFGTNHLGHFALTGLLLPALLNNNQARIVTISSGAHLNAKLDLNDLQSEQGYRRWRAYGRSKLANLLFTYELQRRLEASGASAIGVASHPGWAATNLATKLVSTQRQGLGKLVQGMFNFGAQSAAMGALPTLYAATEPHVQGGAYIGPTGLAGMRGFPGPARSSDRSHNVDDARKLWDLSERLTQVSYKDIDIPI